MVIFSFDLQVIIRMHNFLFNEFQQLHEQLHEQLYITQEQNKEQYKPFKTLCGMQISIP